MECELKIYPFGMNLPYGIIFYVINSQLRVHLCIVALVTATDTECISIEITDAGNTNFEVGSTYTISLSDKLPTWGKGDYIRIGCNPSAVSQADIPHIEEVISVNKTDKTGLSTAD